MLKGKALEPGQILRDPSRFPLTLQQNADLALDYIQIRV